MHTETRSESTHAQRLITPDQPDLFVQLHLRPSLSPHLGQHRSKVRNARPGGANSNPPRRLVVYLVTNEDDRRVDRNRPVVRTRLEIIDAQRKALASAETDEARQ